MLTFSARPFLKTGIIIAFFHESGTKPTDNNWLYSNERGLARQYLHVIVIAVVTFDVLFVADFAPTVACEFFFELYLIIN